MVSERVGRYSVIRYGPTVRSRAPGAIGRPFSSCQEHLIRASLRIYPTSSDPLQRDYQVNGPGTARLKHPWGQAHTQGHTYSSPLRKFSDLTAATIGRRMFLETVPTASGSGPRRWATIARLVSGGTGWETLGGCRHGDCRGIGTYIRPSWRAFLPARVSSR